MHPNLSFHTVELLRAEALRAGQRPRPERRTRRRRALRRRRRADPCAHRVAPA